MELQCQYRRYTEICTFIALLSVFYLYKKINDLTIIDFDINVRHACRGDIIKPATCADQPIQGNNIITTPLMSMIESNIY